MPRTGLSAHGETLFCLSTKTGTVPTWLAMLFLRFAKLLPALFLLGLPGCLKFTFYDIDPGSTNFHTEAEHARLDYNWDRREFVIWITDSKRDLAKLEIVPGTGFVWAEDKTYTLTLTPFTTYNGHGGYDPTERVRSIAFHTQFEPSVSQKMVTALEPGTYNISVQFNGDEGIRTLCGSFRITKEKRALEKGSWH